jgi:hypothetical protein
MWGSLRPVWVPYRTFQRCIKDSFLYPPSTILLANPLNNPIRQSCSPILSAACPCHLLQQAREKGSRFITSSELIPAYTHSPYSLTPWLTSFSFSSSVTLSEWLVPTLWSLVLISLAATSAVYVWILSLWRLSLSRTIVTSKLCRLLAGCSQRITAPYFIKSSSSIHNSPERPSIGLGLIIIIFEKGFQENPSEPYHAPRMDF